MKTFLAGLESVLLRPMQRVGRALRMAPFIFVALLLSIVALGFLTAAVFLWFSTAYGSIIAALVVASGFVVIAAILVAVALWPGAADAGCNTDLRCRSRGEAVLSPLSDSRGGKPPGPEQARFLSGLQLVSALKPYELIGLALFAGFMMGRGRRRADLERKEKSQAP